MPRENYQRQHCIDYVTIHVEGGCHGYQETSPQKRISSQLSPGIKPQRHQQQRTENVPINEDLTEQTMISDEWPAQMKECDGQIVVCRARRSAVNSTRPITKRADV